MCIRDRRSVRSITGAGVAVAGAAERAARRLGPCLLPALPPGETEAAFKLGRLRELRRSGHSPRVLIVGASPSGTCLDPAAISSRGVTGRVFNACLIGATVPVLRRWREMWKREVAPEVVLVGAQPMMFLPPGRFGNSVVRDVAALEAAYEPPSSAYSLALWRWRRELIGALNRRGEPEPHSHKTTNGQHLALMQRHRPDGFLEAFLDVPLADGLRMLPNDWYEYIGSDPHTPPDVDPYLRFLDELRCDGIHPIAVIPPLRLSASPSTSLGGPEAYPGADELIEAATDQSFEVVDFRPLANDDDDFSDVFHVNRETSRRLSEACGDALARLAPKVRV